MKKYIIVSKKGEKPEKVPQEEIVKEDFLQQFILDHPESIPVYEIREDIKLLILVREFGTSSGPIDAIGIDADGNIYLIETKLYKNHDKRFVVTQVLDYGAALWSERLNFEEFRRRIDEMMREKSGVSLDQEIKNFFGLEDDELHVLFGNVSDNLNAGSFRFVVLMDKLHDPLKDLVLFISKNSSFTIYPVEIEYYQLGESKIIIPRLFGAEVKKAVGTSTSGSRGNWDESKFLEYARQAINDDTAYEILAELYRFTKENADQFDFGTGHESGSFTFKLRHPKSKSGLVAVFTVWTDGKIRFRFGNMRNRIGERSVSLFFKKLSGFPFAVNWDERETVQSYGPSAKLNEAFPDQKTLFAFKSAILDFKKELNTL